jgi:vacuolar-type H+-ATPase subunit H
MEAAYISALAALAGTAIGGLTSFATSWTIQRAQTRAQRVVNEKEKREALFGKFVDEAAKLYADALQNKREDAAALMIGIYGLTSRIRLISSARVVESAEAVTQIIMDAYLSAEHDPARVAGHLGRTTYRSAA